MAGRRTVIIGVANGYGAGDPSCQDGPDVLKAFELFTDLNDAQHILYWDELIRGAPHLDRIITIENIATQLAQRIAQHLWNGDSPLVIGGDHSCALGTWSGVKQYLGEEARLGLIWIDAHMDSHTFNTSLSHNIHGMPLACLLGYGDDRLTKIATDRPKLLPQDVCLIGTRSFESGEAALLKELGIRIYFMDEVQRRGMKTVFAEAHRLVCAGTAGYGISLDLDALDPLDAPGVGTPVPGGLLNENIINALHTAHGDKKLLALEIVEYNPYLDKHFVTAQAIHDFYQSLILRQKPHSKIKVTQ
jgi:arginase